MEGLLVFNKYYRDSGSDYVEKSLTESFLELGVSIKTSRQLAPLYAEMGTKSNPPDADFVLFWDKDVALARHLERNGLAVFNSADAIEICDDKRKTYEVVKDCGVSLIPSIFAPLAYAKRSGGDQTFLNAVEQTLGYPMIVKMDVGSLGKQVFLVQNRMELSTLHKKLFCCRHQYQKPIGRLGEDIRVYTVGKEPIFAYRRRNPNSFVSNAAAGGEQEPVPLSAELTLFSQAIAERLNLCFGAIDFLQSNDGQLYFLEANSNAYFAAAERLGANIAMPLARYLCTKLLLTM